MLEVTAESMDSLPTHLYWGYLPNCAHLHVLGACTSSARERKEEMFENDRKQQDPQLGLQSCRDAERCAGIITVKRAEVATSSMSLSPVSSNSLLLSVTHKRLQVAQNHS